MEGGTPDAASLLANANLQLAYFGVLILLILVLVYYTSKSGSAAERMATMGTIGGGVTNRVFTSGAGMRFGQELSSTNQQPYAVPRIADVKAVASALNAGAARTPEQEMLVNQGGYPDFWEITGELDDYRQQDAAAARGGAVERMSTGTSDIFDTALSGGFYPGASTM